MPGVPRLQDLYRLLALESRLCRHVLETYACSPRPPPLVCGLSTCDSDRVCHGVDVVRCRQNALANAPFPLPVFCPLDNIRLAEKRKLADLTAHVSPDCLARALEIMERIWREGEEHMAKLSVNALIGP